MERAAKADPTAKLSSALAGRFEIRRELGAGGMATVYLTEDLKHHRSVAVKVLRPELAMALGRERFLREIEIIANLTHPHILPLHDSDVVDDVYYYVMPYVQGESLRDKLAREHQLPIEDALQIACEVADALAYAHDRGIIHRDIKPHNIMLEAGHAFVTDFGIAHMVQSGGEARLTDTAVSLGTPQYMSPEQVGGARHIDARSDIYSLGCVLYEMLAGQPPFTGPTAYSIMARHATEPAPDVRVLRPSVSHTLDAALRKALAKVPADRYRSAHDFAQALSDASRDLLAARLRAPSRLVRSSDLEEAESGPRTGSASVRTAAHAYRGLLVMGPAALLLSLIGFLNVALFDAVLQVPAPFRPTRMDFPIVGLRTLVPSAVYAFATVIACVFILYIGRLVRRAAVTLTGSRRPVVAASQAGSLRRLWQSLRPSTEAETFFVACFICTIAAVVLLSPTLSALFSLDAGLLGCTNRPDLRVYQPAMTAVITALTFGWVQIFVRRRAAAPLESGGTGTAKWGSLGLIVILTLIMTTPWRLLWEGNTERVLIGADRGYIIRETPSHVVVHNAVRRTSTALEKTQAGLRRLGVDGYIFEEPAAFSSGRPDCTSFFSP